MADTFTPFWGLVQPEVGASRDSWGAKLNGDLAALDTLLQALQPIGAMTDFAGNAAPLGWLLCDGSVYPVAQYPRLAGVIGGFYGGDGVTTFAVPDTRGRSTYGVGGTVGDYGYTFGIGLGERAGDWQIPIGQDQLPAALISTSAAGGHNHPGSVTDVQGNHVHTGLTNLGGLHNHGMPAQVAWHNGGQDAAGGPDSGITSATTTTDGNHTHAFATDVSGAHQHNVAVSQAPDHVHTFALGSGNPLRIVPPLFGTTKIICCGPPIDVPPGGLSSDTRARLIASPLRGVH